MRVQESPPIWGGLVRNIVRGSENPDACNPAELIALIRAGLPVSELDALQNILDVPIEKLAPKLGISKATLHRRKAAGQLEPDESDRVVRFARLMGMAIEVFENEKAARAWMSSPQVGLGGETPLEYATTELGAREVQNLLGRIDQSVYS
jgi:putative toxin-antitoxin system antitoxin component (TIGR02293 family)